MKLTSISAIRFNQPSIITPHKENKRLPYSISNLTLPNYKAHLSFLGGNSLNLATTVINLDKAQERIGKSVYPPNVRENCKLVIQGGNIDNKKLKDVHKETYQLLADCDSLEELKLIFDEFSDVKDAKELDYNKNSFLDWFFNGEIKTKEGKQFLNPNKDLALQLIQAYYLDCLSINDLSEELGLNPYSVMKKLNIPLFSRVYGEYLKLSDEEKNKSIIEAMMRNRAINEVSLKRRGKPLTKEHREKISNSLIEYYKNNPRIGFSRSSEDDEYFVKNPIQDEIFSIVLKRAWEYPEGKTIRKKMSKFFKKNISSDDATDMIQKKHKNKDMEDFWKKHGYLKDKWSEALKKSWQEQKWNNENGIKYKPIFNVRIRPFSEVPKFLHPHSVGTIDTIHTFYILDSRDRNNIKRESDSNIEYYDTLTRDNLKNSFIKDPSLEKMAQSSYYVILQAIKSMLTLVYNFNKNVDKSRSNLLSANYNKTINACYKIDSLLTKYFDEKDINAKSAIEYYDILNKAIEIFIDYDCKEFILFASWFVGEFTSNTHERQSLVERSRKKYLEFCEQYPNLRVD